MYVHVHVHEIGRGHCDRCEVVAQLKRTGVDLCALHMAESDALEAILTELKKSFGYSSFKSSVQERAVVSIAKGKSPKARAPASLEISDYSRKPVPHATRGSGLRD